MNITLQVNGETHTLDIEPRRLLSDVLRQQIGCYGVHLGCEHGVCGACTIRFDGELARSCLIFAIQAENHEVVTIEGTRDSPVAHATRQGFAEEHGLQCGFCTPAFVLAASELVGLDETPDEDTIRQELAGNICRCTGYKNIVAAVKRGSEIYRKAGGEG